jgi:hypothetical protein
MHAALPVEVAEIEPGAPHSDPPSARHVRLCVPDGPTIRVYDPRTVVTPDAVGTERTVELVVVATAIERRHERATGVDVRSGGVPSFQGIVVTFDEAGSDEALLDVGVGTVRFNTATLDERIHVGDFVALSGPTVHVDGMDPAGKEYADFLDQLEAEDPPARREAAAHLGHCGSDRAVDPLVERFRNDPAPSVRRAVVAALGRIAITAYPPNRGPDPRLRSTLEVATGDTAKPVRDAADEWLDRLESRWWA